MVYTILISIVFIAEIIITITIIQNLLRLDKFILEMDETITLAKPGIIDITNLGKNISEQIFELTKDYIEKFKRKNEDKIYRQLSKILLAIILVKINSKTIKKIQRSKITRTIAKGLSFLENMV